MCEIVLDDNIKFLIPYFSFILEFFFLSFQYWFLAACKKIFLGVT